MNVSHDSNRAKARWELLAAALKKARHTHDIHQNEHSVRCFSGFHLYHIQKCDSDEWLHYTLKQCSFCPPIKIRLLSTNVTAEELIGFNNTGNICVWPSEEVLAYYCVKRASLFHKKKICELGGGMTSLAGLQVGASVDADEILLTDGNDNSVANIDAIVHENKQSFRCTRVSCKKLVWTENTDDICSSLKKHYDVVICADALFFTDAHQALVNTIQFLMANNGVCIILAPKRSGTLERFIQCASPVFSVEVSENYDEFIWNSHQQFLSNTDLYSADLHYPILLILRRKSSFSDES